MFVNDTHCETKLVSIFHFHDPSHEIVLIAFNNYRLWCLALLLPLLDVIWLTFFFFKWTYRIDVAYIFEIPSSLQVGSREFDFLWYNSFNHGRNQVCTQRWARLENFPFPDFPRRNFILIDPKQISVVSKSDKHREKKGPLLIFIPFPFHLKFFFFLFTIPLLFLSIFLFSLPLFPLSSSFPRSLSFFLLSPLLHAPEFNLFCHIKND